MIFARRERLGSGRYSPSAVVWHVGVRGTAGRSVAHHNIHFGTEWSSAFDALLKRGELMPDPSRLVTIPSPRRLRSRTRWLLHAVRSGTRAQPERRDQLVDRGCADYVIACMLFLAEQGYPSDMITEDLVTPLEWQAQGMAAGTPFALAHTFSQTGPFRPVKRGAAVARDVLRRLGNRPRGRRSDGADLGQARRQSSRWHTCRGRAR